MHWKLTSAILATASLYVSVCTAPGKTYSLTIRMKEAIPTRPDDLQCTSIKLDPEESYIIKVDPHASKQTAHHMMVFGCEEIDNNNPIWDCHAGESSGSNNSVCRGGERQILFAWAMDATSKSLPEGVGIRVSGETKINYIVVQLHYANVFPDGVTDNSGVTLTMTHHRPPMQAGYLVLYDVGPIPPHKKAVEVDSYCKYTRKYPIYPIGFRTHSHELGYVTSGYRIRDGKWTEIGRMSPQLPQTFYEVSNPGMEIKEGDELASRCTMNSVARDEVTVMGAGHHDEMCNFYIMYATYNQDPLKTELCTQVSQMFHLTDKFPAEDIPKDISSLKGIKGFEKVLVHFHMSKPL
ncbi:peptidyl-glycine alpha-amidating monooxygenase [Plakobranchus ocellatus]|uniref:peptidylglycine monooxygenase n=1 Tax=Plakobranchus ocellatus TaxID=259542 RepID=A0AAV4CV01_9GAST|nr:peptidyl-glycine alpha-amidating monooxygenase [Plakobranchus ocellatus]